MSFRIPLTINGFFLVHYEIGERAWRFIFVIHRKEYLVIILFIFLGGVRSYTLHGKDRIPDTLTTLRNWKAERTGFCFATYHNLSRDISRLLAQVLLEQLVLDKVLGITAG